MAMASRWYCVLMRQPGGRPAGQIEAAVWIEDKRNVDAWGRDDEDRQGGQAGGELSVYQKCVRENKVKFGWTLWGDGLMIEADTIAVDSLESDVEVRCQPTKKGLSTSTRRKC